MPDSTVIANAQRQAELERRHRDLTKPMPPIGSDGESLRQQKGFEGITDEILAERASFNLREHMANSAGRVRIVRHGAEDPNPDSGLLDLSVMTTEQLDALANATLTEMARRQPKEQE